MAGMVINAVRVSSGDSTTMIASEATNSTTWPADNGTMASSPWTTCRSEEARETTWPVRSASCAAPSSRANAAKTS